MTSVSLESGERVLWVQDFEFFLKLLLKQRAVKEVEYDPRRPAVIFTYVG